MKKNIFFTVLAVSAAIVSCSKDTTINSAEFADSNVIGFKTYVPKSLSTRGSAIGPAGDRFRCVRLYGKQPVHGRFGFRRR